MTAVELFDHFLAELPQSIKSLDARGNDDVWTAWVLDYFSTMGSARKFNVRRTDTHKGECEFLVDLCWINESNGACVMELALECEWGEKEAVLYDFCKLIHLKAGLKVMVCALSDQSKEDLLEQVRVKVEQSRFKVTDEQCLIINLPGSEHSDQTGQLRATGDELNTSGQRKALGELSVAC